MTTMMTKNRVSASYVEVTPQQAEQWLANNPMNRAVDRGNVEKLKYSLLNGGWEVTTDAVGISHTGRLLNGQHRLHAIVETGIPATLLVTYGLDDAVIDVLDTGKSRKLSDVLKMRGEVATVRLSSLLKFMVQIDTGRLYRRHTIAAVSNVEALRYLDQHPEARDFNRVADSLSKRIDCGPLPISVAYWLIARAGGDAERFFRQVATRINEPEGSAVHALCSRLTTARVNKQSLDTRNYVYLLITAYNKWILGQPVGQLAVASRSVEKRIPDVVTP